MNRIGRVELPYIPLLEVVAHAFNGEMWYLDPAQTSYARYRVNPSLVITGSEIACVRVVVKCGVL